MAGRYVQTPARLAASRANIAKARKARRRKSHRKYSTNPVARGQGKSGLIKNTVPYVRVNKRSQTGGFNAGTVIPGTGKRIVFGGYVRLENTSGKSGVDKLFGKAANAVAPYGSTRGKVRKYLRNNVQITNPAIRANVGGHQARLSTSRNAGPTITFRRGSHKTPLTASRNGVKAYDRRMRSIAGTKVGRPQRRRRKR